MENSGGFEVRRCSFLWEGGEREKYAREACAACRRGFVGGWLLGCRNSAKTVFQKSELASCSRSDSGLLKNNADFRQPRISSPPAESGDRQHTPHGLVFQGGKGGWLLGSLGVNVGLSGLPGMR